MRYRQLGKTGMRLSIISLGGSGYGNVYGDHNDAVAKKSLEYVMTCLLCLCSSLSPFSLFILLVFQKRKGGREKGGRTRKRERERDGSDILLYLLFVPCCVVILYRYKFSWG